jgi:hypothetical protein
VNRPTKTEKAVQLAVCQNCSWQDSAVGALGRAAQHHDRTGHEVHTEITMRVIYGDRREALKVAGQRSFDDDPEQEDEGQEAG